MSSDLVLTAALRNNLLSLQNSKSAGKSPARETSDAAANTPAPSTASEGVFTPQNLNDRANSLSLTLDSINQSIRTIETASETAAEITALLGEAIELSEAAEKTGIDNIDTLAFQDDFNAIIDRIEETVNNSDFKGTNLVRGDELNVTFGDHPKDALLVTGIQFEASTFLLNPDIFPDPTDLKVILENLNQATELVYNFGQDIRTSLEGIQSRRDFAQGVVDTLNAGAEDLDIADQSEEGANLLALQVRQSLGGTSTQVSLASPAQKSILGQF